MTTLAVAEGWLQPILGEVTRLAEHCWEEMGKEKARSRVLLVEVGCLEVEEFAAESLSPHCSGQCCRLDGNLIGPSSWVSILQDLSTGLVNTGNKSSGHMPMCGLGN